MFKRKATSPAANVDRFHTSTGELSRRQKKKLKKLRKREQAGSVKREDSGPEIPETAAPERKSYRQKIVEELGLESLHEKPERLPTDQTEGTAAARPNVVVFYDAARKRKFGEKKAVVSLEESDKEDKDTSPEFDFKKARYEILKFGISGFEKVHKEEARTALAIKLGAKPPKKQFENYKVLMDKRREEKARQKRDRELNQKLGLNKKSKVQKQKTRS